MKLTQGVAFVGCVAIGFIIGLLMDELVWGLVIGAAAGVLIEAYLVSQRR